MFIQSLRIQNYRSFKDSGEIPFLQQVTFLGTNGGGKSNILRAIRLFYDVNAMANVEDYFNRNTEVGISISMTFRSLNADELNYFGAFVQSGVLSVEKQFSFALGGSKGQYYGKFKQHRQFSAIRAVTGRERINAYRDLRNQNNPEYADLPTAASGQAVDEALTLWETNHQDQLEWIQAPVQFFGARNIGGGSLDNFTRFILVPAVRDASIDAGEGRGGALGDLINILVKEVVFQRRELIEFKARTVEEFKRLTNPDQLTEIPDLERRLTERLRTFVANSAVHLAIGEVKEPVFNFPETKVELTEDEFRGQVEGKGHGLQRSFIISIVQELSLVQAQRDEQLRRLNLPDRVERPGEVQPRVAADFRPDLILAIEEPELFQHPIRQRHFANILSDFAKKDIATGRARIQVILTSHSPYFVSMRRFDSIRAVAKETDAAGDLTSTVKIGNPSRACATFCTARGIADPEVQQFMDGLRNIMDVEVNEAFFSQCVVLVEGGDDRAALDAVFRQNGIDPVSTGLPIVAVDGKCNLARVRSILETVGIISYLVFDCDNDKTGDDRARHEVENRTVLTLGNAAADQRAEFPATPIVTPSFGCFPTNLEQTLVSELVGFDFINRRNAIAQAKKVGAKSPIVYEATLAESYARGIRSATLDRIATAILALVHTQS